MEKLITAADKIMVEDKELQIRLQELDLTLKLTIGGKIYGRTA